MLAGHGRLRHRAGARPRAARGRPGRPPGLTGPDRPDAPGCAVPGSPSSVWQHGWVMKSSVSATPRRRTARDASGPPGSNVVPATCCPGCAPATSPSSTTSTWTAPRAQALVDAGVVAVVDAAAIISGPLPEPRPAAARRGRRRDRRRHRRRRAGARSPTAATVRLHEGAVTSATREVASGPRPRRGRRSPTEMERARSGLATQLAGAHPQQHRVPAARAGPAAARPRRARGWPPAIARPPGRRRRRRLRPRRASSPAYARSCASSIRSWSRVGAAADALRQAGVRADVVVVDADDELPSAAALRAARDVVVRADRGSTPGIVEQIDRLGVRPAAVETAAAPEDAALVLADAADPTVIVAVGMRATRRGAPRQPAARRRRHLPHPAQGRPAPRRRAPPCRTSTPAGSVRGTCCW